MSEANDLLKGYHSSQEDAEKAALEDLVPIGRFEGTVVEHTTTLGEREGSFYGEPITRIRTELYGVEGRERRAFSFNVSAAVKYRADGSLERMSKNFLALAKATGTLGKEAEETLEVAKTMRLAFRIGQYPGGERDGRVFEPGNVVYNISVVR